MNTPTKEERAEWRKKASEEPFYFGHRNIRLLNALEHTEAIVTGIAESNANLGKLLESAEDRAEQAEATIESWEHGSDCGTCPLQNEPACDEICSSKAKLIEYCAEERTRAEAAEREREILADVLENTGGEFACCIGCPFPEKRETKCKDAEDDYPHKQCWLEWARQQARGGEI